MKLLYAKTTALVDSKDYLRFIITGCFNTGLSFVIYSAGILLGLHYVIANLIAWIISVIISFHLSSTFVFRKGVSYKRFGKFVLSNLVSLVVSLAMLTLLIKGADLHEILASLITIPFVVAINYLAGKFFVFKQVSP